MEVVLECTKSTVINLAMYGEELKELNKGEIIKSKFSDFGVKLLINNVWSFEFSYETIKKYFKIYGQ